MNEKLDIELTEMQSKAIRAAIEAGDYDDSREIVAEALQDWIAKRLHSMADVERLRRLWDEGLASGKPRPVDFDTLRQTARRRLKDAEPHGG